MSLIYDNDLKQKLKKYYPDVDIENIDPLILDEMIFCMLELEIDNQNDESNVNIVNANKELAYMQIPEMFFDQNMIFLKGKINGVPLTFMIDTGASICMTYNCVAEKCGLKNFIDSNEIIHIMGAHSVEKTLGKIWYVEIELEINLNENQFGIISIPISMEISHDIKHDSNNDENKNNTNDRNHDVILGMSFLRSYKVNIDFYKRILTLNDNIKISFD